MALFLMFVLRQQGHLQYDAQNYWDATRSLLGVVATPNGYWEFRGVLTAILFLPAAAVSTLLDPTQQTLPVLIQNSVVFAAAGAFLMPALLRVWVTPTLAVRVIAGGLVWLATAHFSPYSLVDVYAALGIIASIVLLSKGPMWRLFLAGAVMGVSVNVRPAYAVVAVFLVIIILVRRRWRGVSVLAGIALALAPQLILNAALFGTPALTPVDSNSLVALQAGYASYTVRYDTMLGESNARQFYCSPEMATFVEGAPPSSVGELALTFLQSLPVSLLFALQKAGASLFWPVNTPYSTATSGVDSLNGVVITAVAVVGLAALFALTLGMRRRMASADLTPLLLVGATVVGSVLTIVASASEARFALVIILLGAAGVAAVAAPRPGGAVLRFRWIPISLLVLIGTLLLGTTGLDHPAPRGEADAAVCANTR